MSIKKVNYSWILLVFCLICACRCFFGFEWSDESYYAALSYRLCLGDVLFKNVWDAMQLTGFITVPFVWIFKTVTGGTTGLILYLRLLFTVFQSFGAFYCYRNIKKNVHDLYALLTAVLFLFVPNSIRTINYKSIINLLFPFLLVQICRAVQTGSNKASYCSGILTGIMVFSYPSMILLVLIQTVWWICNKACRKLILPYYLGGFTVIGVFLVYLCTNSSISNVLKYAHYMIGSDEYSYLSSPLRKLRNYAAGIAFAFGPKSCTKWFALITLFYSAYLLGVRKKTKATDLVTTIMIVSLSFLAFYNLCTSAAFKAYVNLSSILIMTAVYYHSVPMKSLVLTAMGLCYSVALQILSDMGGSSSFHPFIFLIAAALLMMQESDIKKSKQTLVHTAVLSAAVLACFFANTMRVYRDAPLSEDRYVLSGGIGAGIMTNRSNEKKYTTITSDLSRMNLEHEHLLVSDLLPIAYFYSEEVPDTPTVWRVEISSNYLNQYFQVTGSMPSTILLIKPGYGDGNEKNPLKAEKTEFLKHYRTTEYSWCTRYTLVK